MEAGLIPFGVQQTHAIHKANKVSEVNIIISNEKSSLILRENTLSKALDLQTQGLNSLCLSGPLSCDPGYFQRSGLQVYSLCILTLVLPSLSYSVIIIVLCTLGTLSQETVVLLVEIFLRKI